MRIVLQFVSHLDVTIRDFWTTGLGTHSQLHVMLPDKIQSLQHILLEGIVVGDVLVRRAHNESALRTTTLHFQGSPRHCWHRVSAHRFHQDVFILDAWNLLLHQLAIVLVCHDDNVVCVDKTRKSFVCHLEQGLAHSQHIDELLWLLLTAHWPQARTLPTCQYDTIIPFIHIHLIGLVGLLG